jgi:phospholipase/lecithinase/hemolysin
MNNLRVRWRATMSAAAVALLLAACGGGDGDQTPRVAYGKLVSFGDSLSDVGSYAVGFVAASGGGKYTINGPEAKNWTELLAAQMGVAAPCAAQTTRAVTAMPRAAPASPTPSGRAMRRCWRWATRRARWAS